jgi:hypothetical protein
MRDDLPPGLPSRSWLWSNFLATQIAWFAAVLGAAHGFAGWACVPALAVVVWHLWRAPQTAREGGLIALAAIAGTLADALVLRQGAIAYASGQWSAVLPPLWITGLWAVFATSLNVTLRWLHGRWWLAALLGAVAGPLAFASGARLGAAEMLQPARAMGLLALEWALVLPALCALARRLDGARPAALPSHPTT